MHHSPLRRRLLLATGGLPLAGIGSSVARAADTAGGAEQELAALEARSGGRLGVAARTAGSDARIVWRGAERFAFCSTFKVIAVSTLLQRASRQHGLLDKQIAYSREDLVAYSPITEKHVATGLDLAALCAAALQYSDNTAANLILRELGGPAAVTAFARSIGDTQFRLDRWETALNSARPDDLRDTTTPAAMAQSLERLLLGEALGATGRERLRDWMLGNTTGAARIRAGVPADWRVADKTGTGDYGSTNDIGVLWPPARAPIVLAIYFTQPQLDAKPRDDVLAQAARIVATALTAQ
ncbi:class A beta-lactamase [Niveibacterium sp. SC-1]|uniref:class A beta-lactamase n=1 Tax=Niveibacterium sp. SC-1 TaxID=3135646 RepID=UPI00311FA0B6